MVAEKLGSDHPELFFKSEEEDVISNVLEQLMNNEKVDFFLMAIENPNNFSKLFVSSLAMEMRFPFVINNIAKFNRSELLYFFGIYMKGGQFEWAATLLSKVIAEGQSNSASDIFEKYLEENEIDDQQLQNLIDKISNEDLAKLLNASLKKTVWEIFCYGLTAKRLEEILLSVSPEEAKKFFRFDDLMEYYFPQNGYYGYPERTQKQQLLKEHLKLISN